MRQQPMTDEKYSAERQRLTQELEALELQRAAEQKESAQAALDGVVKGRMAQCQTIVDCLTQLSNTDLGRVDGARLDEMLGRVKAFQQQCCADLGEGLTAHLDAAGGVSMGELAAKVEGLSAVAAAFGGQRTPPARKSFSLASCLRYVLCCGCCSGDSSDDDSMRYDALNGSPKR